MTTLRLSKGRTTSRDDLRNLAKEEEKIVLARVEPAAFHEPIGQHEMPTAQHGSDANHVRPALLAPHVVALDGRQQLARARQERPASDAGQLLFEFCLDRRGAAR